MCGNILLWQTRVRVTYYSVYCIVRLYARSRKHDAGLKVAPHLLTFPFTHSWRGCAASSLTIDDRPLSLNISAFLLDSAIKTPQSFAFTPTRCQAPPQTKKKQKKATSAPSEQICSKCECAITTTQSKARRHFRKYIARTKSIIHSSLILQPPKSNINVDEHIRCTSNTIVS